MKYKGTKIDYVCRRRLTALIDVERGTILPRRYKYLTVLRVLHLDKGISWYEQFYVNCPLEFDYVDLLGKVV